MKKITLALMALAPLSFFTPLSALAHGGHVDVVAGHTHSIIDLIMLSAIPAVLIIALVAFFIIRYKNNG